MKEFVFYNDAASIKLMDKLARTTFFEDWEKLDLPYMPVAPVTYGKIIDWLMTKGVYVDISPEDFKVPTWSWCVEYIGDAWSAYYEAKKSGRLGVLEGSVKTFFECAEGAIVTGIEFMNLIDTIKKEQRND